MSVDLLIVGGGPAGLAAAVEAARAGFSVLLLDENAEPARNGRGETGQELVAAFQASTAQAQWDATVWAIEADGQVFWSDHAGAHALSARTILLATGAIERPLPIQGWTLPGVSTLAGGAPAGARLWLAGQGPALLCHAMRLLDEGREVAGVIDLSNSDPTERPDPRLAQAGVRWIMASDLRAEGDTALRGIAFLTQDAWRSEAADVLLLHDGMIPSVQISRALGCAHRWDERHLCWQPVVDAWGRTSVPKILIAGDAAGVDGEEAAELSGRIAAIGLAGGDASGLQAKRDQYVAVHAVQASRFPPRPMRLDDTTVVCPCEGVTAAAVRAAAGSGCQGMNQLKAYTRCGMGPCQGRICGPVGIEVLAEAHSIDISAIEPLRTRFPTKPIPVGALLSL